MRAKLSVGVGLIVIGLGLYALQFIDRDFVHSVVLTGLGVACLAGYLYARSSFLLVVGGVVTGLGIGSFGDRWEHDLNWIGVGEFTRLGLGIGFLTIWALRLIRERRSHWWPLVPAGVLLLLAFRQWGRFREFLFSSNGWPILLVIVGVLILLGSIGRRRPAARSS